MILDLGGVTVDVVTDDAEIITAGCGNLLTAAVGLTLDVSRGTAEWVKRVPRRRVEPYLVLEEDGARSFLPAPASADTVGSLVVPGPAGLLPFNSQLSPSKWRGIRLRLKQQVVAAGLRRARDVLNAAHSIIAAGGPAGAP